MLKWRFYSAINTISASTSASTINKLQVNNDLLTDEELALRGDFNGIKSSIIEKKVVFIFFKFIILINIFIKVFTRSDYCKTSRRNSTQFSINCSQFYNKYTSSVRAK